MAVFSKCGHYRYSLGRYWGDGPTVAFVGVNPSTATAAEDDATVRKWRGFTQRWGFAGFDVVNLFAYRSTDVRNLAPLGDHAVGQFNDYHMRQAFFSADLIVPCWGDRAKLPLAMRGRIDEVRAILRGCRQPVRILGLTAGGDPKHPLMLGYATQLQDWQP